MGCRISRWIGPAGCGLLVSDAGTRGFSELMMPSKMVFALGGCCTYILRSAKIGLRSSAGSPSLMCKCGHPGVRDAGIAIDCVVTDKRGRCPGRQREGCGRGRRGQKTRHVFRRIVDNCNIWLGCFRAVGIVMFDALALVFLRKHTWLEAPAGFLLGPVSYGGMLAATTESWISARIRSSACP